MRSGNWLDRVVGAIAPRAQLRRVRARIAQDVILRHYEAASSGYRTQGWNRHGGDANAANARNAALSRVRDVARDLVRNNPYAEAALTTIADHAVGWGIVGKALPKSERFQQAWDRHANTTDIDADGRHDLAGLQKLVMRTVARDGEVLVRRRWRLMTDGYALPFQLQVLEADFLDTSKSLALPGGGQIVQGVEFDALGKRVAYWLFPTHPGTSLGASSSAFLSPSRRIPAEDVTHVYKADRPGQVRAVSWFGPIILRLKDADEYEDATLVKQKIAASLAIATTDVDGTGPALGTADDTGERPVDQISPGAILNLPTGREVHVIQPPSVREHREYMSVTLRAIAAGIGVTYEDLTGDYTELPYSAARMSRLRHWARVEDWRWRLLIPQFCQVTWQWALDAAEMVGITDRPAARWSAPPMPLIEPDKESLALQREVRNGSQTLSDALRERGYDPDELFEERAAELKKLDGLGIVVDTDPRKTTQAGQIQSSGGTP